MNEDWSLVLKPSQLNTTVTTLAFALILKTFFHFLRRYYTHSHPVDLFGLLSSLSALIATTMTLFSNIFEGFDCAFRSYFGSGNYCLSYTMLYIHFLLKARLLYPNQKWTKIQMLGVVTIIWYLATSIAFTLLNTSHRTSEGICQNSQNQAVTIVLAVCLATNNLVLTGCFVIPLKQIINSKQTAKNSGQRSKYELHYIVVRRVTLATGVSGFTSALLYTLVLAAVLGEYTLMFFYAEWAVSVWAASFSLPIPKKRLEFEEGFDTASRLTPRKRRDQSWRSQVGESSQTHSGWYEPHYPLRSPLRQV